MGKKVKKTVKKAVKNPIVQTVGAGLIGGPIGAAAVGAGSFLGGGGLGGDEENRQTNSTRLSPSGQAQFDFAAGQFQDLFNQGPITAAGGDFSQAINALNGIDFGGINGAIGDLQNFNGTAGAFRTLDALEAFGAGEQGFVTDARNSVLNFDEGFESSALPLLQQAAEGQFLTEAAGNPFLRDAIEAAQRPVIDSFNSEVLPGILSTFAGTGGVGSSLRAGFTAQNARDLQRTLGDIGTNLSFNTFESERNRQLAAQQAILGFEDAGLGRQLSARQSNLQGSLQSAGQQLQARQAAASGQVSLSGQRQAALAAALQGQLGAGNLQISQANGFANIGAQQQQLNQFNAQQEQDRLRLLIGAQQAASAAGADNFQNFIKPGLF